MSESIEGVLQESLLQAAEDGGTTVNGLVTIRLEALKEIEAIIMAARPSPRPPVNLTTDPQVAAFRNGYEDAIDYYQDHLKQALYGKDEKQLEAEL